MEPDTALTLGCVIGMWAIPAMVSALVDKRRPRLSIAMILAAGGLIYYAYQNNPGGYELAEVPDIFVTVIGRMLQ